MHTPSSARKTIACRIPGSPARTWRCHRCGAVLGVEQDGELHVKYKDCQHWISGRCRHPCRRCGAMNTLDVAGLPPSVACTNTSVES